MTDLRTLRRLGLLGAGGVTAYAVSLGGVALLQSQTEAAATAAQAPLVSALDATSSGNDALFTHLGNAVGAYNNAADQYGTIDAQIAAIERNLAQLSKTMAPLAGGVATTSNALPKLLARVKAIQPPPAVHTTTRASGAKP